MVDDEHARAALYSTVSPIFDVPEFPPLRRVVPLPKRRRRIIDASLDGAPEHTQLTSDRAQNDSTKTTPDDLANSLSTSMALSSYYRPLFQNWTDLFKDDIDPRHVDPSDLLTQSKYRDGVLGSAEDRDDGDRENGGYMDHLTQPGNTKKRKVPVAANARGGDDTAQDGSDDLADSSFPADRGVAEVVTVVPPVPPPLVIPPRRGKISRATQAGLQLKEMLKTRKRQLSKVLGALSHNDSLALDQALATIYPVLKGRAPGRPPIRQSRRPERIKARTASAANKKCLPAPGDENVRAPEGSFTFEYDSATSERVRATNEEVAYLHGRFDAEFSRQSSKAARAAEANRLAAMRHPQWKAKRERDEQRAHIASQLPGIDGDSASTNQEKMVAGSKSKTKKKKRSALANASNPHHLRNYVPSRLPNSGSAHSAQAAINAQNHLGPPPLRFLSAELPPRAKKSNGAPPTSTLTNPEDEWICAFCEYSLFYGDEHSFVRAIRQRKKILSRRRRAMERAAAAAAGGKKGVVAPEKEGAGEDDLADEFELPPSGVQAASKHTGLQEEQDRDRDKGGGGNN